MPCMYEDIYRIYTGENLKTQGWEITAEEYEKIMTTYFPVSVEQLREHCRYNADHNSYEYEMIYASPYPPPETFAGQSTEMCPQSGLLHRISSAPVFLS